MVIQVKKKYTSEELPALIHRLEQEPISPEEVTRIQENITKALRPFRIHWRP